MDSTDPTAGASDLDSQYARPKPKKIRPEDVIYAFGFDNHVNEFTSEEQLRFAIAFKRTPKAFDQIAAQIPLRLPTECKDHYYSKKLDGRFKTKSWEATNIKHEKKKFAALPEGDRRMQGLPTTNGLVTPTSQEQHDHVMRLMKLVPIDQEIDRLLKAIPWAASKYADALADARKEQDAREAAETEQQRADKSNKKAKKKSSVDPIKPFEELRATLETTGTSVTGILREFAMAQEGFQEALSDHDPNHNLSEVNLRTWRRLVQFHKDRLWWIDDALVAAFDENKKIDDPEGQLVTPQVHLDLLSIKAGIARPESDRKSLVKQIKVQESRKGRRRDNDAGEVNASAEALAGREAQIEELKSLARTIRATMDDAFSESGKDEENDEIDENEKNDETSGDRKSDQTSEGLGDLDNAEDSDKDGEDDEKTNETDEDYAMSSDGDDDEFDDEYVE